MMGKDEDCNRLDLIKLTAMLSKLACSPPPPLKWGAQKLMGENLKLIWVEF
jgi:hypothetical protein